MNNCPRETNKSDYLESLYQISLKLSSKLQLDDLLKEIIISVKNLVATANVFFYIYEQDRKVLVMKIVDGFYNHKHGYEIPVGAGLAGKVLRDKKTIAIQDYQNWPDRLPDKDWYKIGSIACSPIIARDEIIGVIGIIHETGTNLPITDHETDIIDKFSAMASIAITNAKLFKDLREANDKIKVLTGFIPICANCKKIKDDKGYWNQIENYISEHSEAVFNHGLCPDCVESLYPDLANENEGKAK